MIQYCLGFLFDIFDRDKVALIRKNRPSWQAGLLNGIGGKLEEGETYRQAMVREFFEETGNVAARWNLFAELFSGHSAINGQPWKMGCFYGFGVTDLCESKTDEKIEIIQWPLIGKNKSLCVENTPWLLEMAISFRAGDIGAPLLRVEYVSPNDILPI